MAQPKAEMCSLKKDSSGEQTGVPFWTPLAGFAFQGPLFSLKSPACMSNSLHEVREF